MPGTLRRRTGQPSREAQRLRALSRAVRLAHCPARDLGTCERRLRSPRVSYHANRLRFSSTSSNRRVHSVVLMASWSLRVRARSVPRRATSIIPSAQAFGIAIRTHRWETPRGVLILDYITIRIGLCRNSARSGQRPHQSHREGSHADRQRSKPDTDRAPRTT